MSKIPTFPRYRVKGLPDVHACESPEPEVHQTKPITTLSAMDRVLNAMPRPHLSDYLHDFSGLEKLAALWPTFSFLHPQVGAKPIKSLPMQLASFLDEEPSDEDYLPNTILKEYNRQQAEKSAILLLLKAHEEGEEPDVADCPITMAMACHLFAGSSWLKSNEKKIQTILLNSHAAAYMALASGRLSDSFLRQFLKVLECPQLALELSRSPQLAKQIGAEWFQKALEIHPLYHAAWLHASGDALKAYAFLQMGAKRDSLAAAACLGLDPHHPNAHKWRKTAWESHEAIYWAGRIWMTGNDDITKFPHSGSACTRLVDDPQWYYHWLRDCESQDLEDKLFLIWPELWSVEFMLDQEWPISSFFNLNNRRELTCDDPIETAIALWLADHSLKVDED